MVVLATVSNACTITLQLTKPCAATVPIVATKNIAFFYTRVSMVLNAVTRQTAVSTISDG
jgi:hypothetical protein